MDHTTYTLALIVNKAQTEPKTQFTSLVHLLDERYLLQCYKQLQAHKAPGVDNRTVESYTEAEISEAICQLVQDLKANTYRPQSVRRVYIPKANGTQRPLGIPSVIDKVLQRAVANILEPLFEPLFQDTSYGFRPNRDAHGAVKAVNRMVMAQKVNWIIDADIKDFFGTVNHDWLMQCLQQRISDPNLLRLIARFLKAGVMENDRRLPTPAGTPQGGIISPILANIYLHYVLDLWIEVKMKQQLKGYVEIVRYADDFVIGVQYRHEAYQLLEAMTSRLTKFGLELAADKTHILEFGRYASRNRVARGQGKPQTFDFLGFTHFCGVTKDGRFSLQVKTSRKKYKAAIRAQKDWLKAMRQQPIKDSWPLLAAKLRGHYNYYAVSGNFAAVQRYYAQTGVLIFKWMNRRSQKRTWNWEQFQVYLERHPLPQPKVTYAIYNS